MFGQAQNVLIIFDPTFAVAPMRRLFRSPLCTHPDPILFAVNQNKKRAEEIKQNLDDRRNGRSASSSGQQGIKNKLAELRTQFQTVLVS